MAGVYQVLNMEGRVEDAAHAVRGDEGAEGDDGEHEGPEQGAEDLELEAVHDAREDGEAVEYVAGFLHLVWQRSARVRPKDWVGIAKKGPLTIHMTSPKTEATAEFRTG